jgi:glyoxylase-like metal-dependent hydrolase (beta-lactamase superfamily II)
MSGFYEETKGIYRLRVPFENIYTSVFLIMSEENKILADCGTTAYDVDSVILPALSELGYTLADLNMLVLTHHHGDHAGGLARIREIAPNIEVVTDVREIFENVSTYALPGHTEDSIGILDERTGTLISGDGLQGAGVDKYRCYTKCPTKYIETLEKIKSDGRIENILFSHAYEPWNTDTVFGREKVIECINECKNYVRR